MGPLWIATTATEGVTELFDRRVFAADTVVIPLRGDLPGAPGLIAEALVAHDGLVLEDIPTKRGSQKRFQPIRQEA